MCLQPCGGLAVLFATRGNTQKQPTLGSEAETHRKLLMKSSAAHDVMSAALYFGHSVQRDCATPFGAVQIWACECKAEGATCVCSHSFRSHLPTSKTIFDLFPSFTNYPHSDPSRPAPISLNTMVAQSGCCLHHYRCHICQVYRGG